MEKKFFLVVPFTASIIKGPSGIGALFNFGKKKNTEQRNTDKLAVFEENRSQLDQRVSVVTQGLSRCGVRLARLGTEELVELYYKTFNPGELGKPLPVDQQ